MIDIYIPTSGRWESSQRTLHHLLNAGITPTLVVQYGEQHNYRQRFSPQVPMLVLPEGIDTISATRDHLVHGDVGVDKMIMLDDDLDFAVRRTDDRSKFREPNPDDLRQMFRAIEAQLDLSPHVGIGAREGGNRVTSRLVYNTRIMRVLAYRRSFLRKNLITFAPMELMEDFHVSLQILRAGEDVVVCNDWVSNQGGSNTAGGCSVYRTEALQTASANQLAALHPGFVRVVQKATKIAWGGRPRTDVIVQWKKAREAGRSMV